MTFFDFNCKHFVNEKSRGQGRLPAPADKKKETRRARLPRLSVIQMYCFMPSVAVSSSALMVTVNFTPFSSLKRSSQ